MQYTINKGSKSYGYKNLFENINFEIKNNEKIAIVGNNGCGKTTLLRIISNEEYLDDGNIFKSNNLTIGYLSQTTFNDINVTLRSSFDEVFSNIHDMEKKISQISKRMVNDHSEEILEEYSKISLEFENIGGYTYQSEMEQVLTKFGFRIEDLDKQLSTFSGGQKTRLAFVKLLLSKPDILLLDEPTNHLDLETIKWLEGYIKRYPKAVVLVSHDRYFLDRVVDVIYDIEFSKMNRYVGNYTNYIKVKKEVYERDKMLYYNQQKEIERLQVLIEKFRYKKNKAAFAQSKIKYLDKMDVLEDPKLNDKSFNVHFNCRISGANNVLELDNYLIGYENHELLKLSLLIKKHDKIAIIGNNGCGKSTLLKSIVNKIEHLSGDARFGHHVEIGYFDQEFSLFDNSNSVLEEVWNDFPELTHTKIRSVLGRFLFSSDDVFKTIDCLSGGEKVRLALSKLMLQQANFLILDEPTNHLDLLSKEALEESLNGYDGTILFVSHDRYFISNIATKILEISDNSYKLYDMSYQEYLDKDNVDKVNDKIVKDKVVQEVKLRVKPINYSREIKKLEKIIEENEILIEELRDKRFEPDYYHDYKKMQELDNKIDEVNNKIQNAMNKWEEFMEFI